MVKELKKRNNYHLSNVFFLGKNLEIYKSLKNLSAVSNNYILQRINYSKKLIHDNELLIIDDSVEEFKKIILLLRQKNFNNFLTLISEKNIKILEGKNYKVFFKPLKLFELNKEICDRISKNVQFAKGWKLDRSKLKFYKSNNYFIELTEKEFYFIFFLLKNEENVVSKEKLLKKVWGFNLTHNNNLLNSRVVETIVSRIRKKLKKLKKGPQLIKNKEGYQLLI